MRKIQIILIFFILFNSISYSNIVYEYYADKNEEIVIGDIISINLDIWVPENFAFDIAGISELQSESYIIIGEEPFTKKFDKEKNSYFHRKSIKIICAKEGKTSLPPMKIEYWHNEEPDKKSLLLTNPISLNILSNIAGDDIELRDIRGPFEIKASYIYLLFIVFVLIALILLLFYFYYYKNKQLMEKPEEIIPPENTAYIRLRDLLDKKYLQKGFLKIFLFELTSIIKEYIGNAYFINAVDMTSNEIDPVLKSTEIDPDLYNDLMAFLRECDIYKFSNISFDRSRAKELYDSAFSLVEIDASGRKKRMIYEKQEGVS